MRLERKIPPTTWLQRYCEKSPTGRALRLQHPPPNWKDRDAVEQWAKSLPFETWQRIQAAYRVFRHQSKKRDERDRRRVRELGLLQFDGDQQAVEEVLDHWLRENGREDWRTLIGLAPEDARPALVLLHARHRDAPPWRAISAAVMRGLND
ncbi:MAG: hypothetical protein R3E46_04205 [Sedimenticolaceae bacterium]